LHEPFTVILDMEKLSSISRGAARQLNKIITLTAWDQRKFSIRNASKEVLAELEKTKEGGSKNEGVLLAPGAKWNKPADA
jgi:hypothetical protein